MTYTLNNPTVILLKGPHIRYIHVLSFFLETLECQLTDKVNHCETVFSRLPNLGTCECISVECMNVVYYILYVLNDVKYSCYLN